MASVADDAVMRYLRNNAPKPAPKPTGSVPINQRQMETLASGGTLPTPAPAPSGGGGGEAPTPPPPLPPADWSAYLGMFGLPSDVLNELNAIFARTPDVGQATSIALAYVRGTPWYAQTYPGIQEAIAKGVVQDERGYRSLRNNFAQVYQQYAGRDITNEEYAGYLRTGTPYQTVAQRFQGAAISNVYAPDWQYLQGAFGEGRLDAGELKAFGEQQAGLDSELGLRIQRRMQQAQERIRAAFSGSLAVGRMAQPLNQAGTLPDVGR